MNRNLTKSVKSHFKAMFAATLLVVGAQQANAQSITFGTLYIGDPATGSLNTSTNAVLSLASGTGANFVKPGTSPTSLAADGNGNLAIGFNSGNRISRIDKNATTMVVFQTGAITYNSLGIDKNNEYIYYGGTGTIQRSIWANTGLNTSVGFYSASAAGTATTNVKAIPFLTSTDLVYFNGSATLSGYTFGSVRGIAFDAAGNLYYADNTNHVVRKVSIVKQTVAGNMASGVSSLTLTDITGVKVGSIVSGINIPASTYVGTIDAVNKVITLTQADLTTARTTTAVIDNTASIAFVTGVDNIVGTGTASASAVALGGAAGTTPLSFNAATYGIGLVFDAAGNLYVTDQAWSRIVKIAATAGVVNSSSIITELVSGANIGNSTAGLAIDNAGKIYITKRAVHNIVRTTAVAGAVETVAGSTGKTTITSYTTASGSTTVTAVTAASVTALKVGMTLRGTNFALGTKVLAKVDATTFTTTIAATGTGTGATATATTEDGFTTPGIGTTNTGSFDGPAGIVIANDNIYVAESTGSYVRVLTSLTTLPVTLSKDFTAKLAGSAVNLSWTSASEQNNKAFIIKRSSDALSYAPIKTVDSKGTDGAAYATADFNPLSGDNYYQLSQVDNDGTTKILGVQVVKVILKAVPFSIYPNPVQGSLFSINATSVNTPTLAVKITDMGGKQIYNQILSRTEDGKYEIQLGTKAAPGIYIITVNGADAQKLIIK